MAERGPLDGLVVLDLAQYLAGPSAALRLADLGARVVKVERPGSGDGSRALALRRQFVGPDSLLFHTINRGKESITADLADPGDRAALQDWIRRADVLIHSFRPGTLERRGLGSADVARLNAGLVYASVSGYGEAGPWQQDPGQDLLVQARSGMSWLSGANDAPPTPIGLSLVDQYAGSLLVQGILACLVRRGSGRAGARGGRVQVSLLEAAMDLQFEAFTAYLNGAGTPQRSALSPAHPYNEAPYGIYRTADGWVALAMGPLPTLAQALDLPDLEQGLAGVGWGEVRDLVKARLTRRLAQSPTATVLAALAPHGFWCAEVLDWPALVASGALAGLDLLVDRKVEQTAVQMLGCPVRIDGRRRSAEGAGPPLGRRIGS